jgi:hypothetical protein
LNKEQTGSQGSLKSRQGRINITEDRKTMSKRQGKAVGRGVAHKAEDIAERQQNRGHKENQEQRPGSILTSQTIKKTLCTGVTRY